MSLAPSRLSDVENSAYFKEVCQDNFEVLAEEIAKRVATYQNGSPTTIIGPPNSGARVLNEFWRDALGGEWRCMALPWGRDPRDVDPDQAGGGDGRPVIGDDGAVKRHAGAWSWEITVGANASAKVGFHGATPAVQRANANQLILI